MLLEYSSLIDVIQRKKKNALHLTKRNLVDLGIQICIPLNWNIVISRASRLSFTLKAISEATTEDLSSIPGLLSDASQGDNLPPSTNRFVPLYQSGVPL